MSTRDTAANSVEVSNRSSTNGQATGYEKLRLENDDLRFEVSRLRESVERQQQQIFELNHRLSKGYDSLNNDTTDRELNRLREKEKFLNEILASRSWRLTRGYRFIGVRLQRMLGGKIRR